jgi:outer membrane protein OmpA-like peptidoglycan-associated protein
MQLALPALPTRERTRRYPNVFVFPRERIADPCGNVILVANLWNFAVARADLLPDHKEFLRYEVAPWLLADPAAGARCVGLASRSGSDWFNLQLGLQRAKATQAELWQHIATRDALDPPGPPPRITVGSQGERFAARQGVRDGTEEARHRAVLVTVLRDRKRSCDVRLLPA